MNLVANNLLYKSSANLKTHAPVRQRRNITFTTPSSNTRKIIGSNTSRRSPSMHGTSLRNASSVDRKVIMRRNAPIKRQSQPNWFTRLNNWQTTFQLMLTQNPSSSNKNALIKAQVLCFRTQKSQRILNTLPPQRLTQSMNPIRLYKLFLKQDLKPQSTSFLTNIPNQLMLLSTSTQVLITP